MTSLAHQTAAVEWKNDHFIFIGHREASPDYPKKIHTLEEVKELIKHSAEEYVCLVTSIYGLTLSVSAYETEDPKDLQMKLLEDYKDLAVYQKNQSNSLQYVKRLLKSAQKSKSVNGAKTDIMHEAIRIQIELEEQYAAKRF